MSNQAIGRGVRAAGASLLLAAAGPAVDATVTNGRMSVVMYSRPAAGYFDLRNDGDAPLTLTGAETPKCGSLELHRSLDAGGMARMEAVKQVKAPPHQAIRFEPGSYHLMCLDPDPSLKPGGTMAVTLRFEGGGTVSARFGIVGPIGR